MEMNNELQVLGHEMAVSIKVVINIQKWLYKLCGMKKWLVDLNLNRKSTPSAARFETRLPTKCIDSLRSLFITPRDSHMYWSTLSFFFYHAASKLTSSLALGSYFVNLNDFTSNVWHPHVIISYPSQFKVIHHWGECQGGIGCAAREMQTSY